VRTGRGNGTPGGLTVAAPRIGVLVSGSGTTLQNLLDRRRAGTLAAEIAVVVSSEPGVRALDRARDAGLAVATVPWRGSGGAGPFGISVTAVLEEAGADLALLAGFLRLYRFPDRWRWRVMNIHPALLPAFGGRGMYGAQVHEAVIRSGAKVSGCTVHFADHAYDRGPIILQRTCPVRLEDSPDELARRVFALEQEAYPEAVRLYAEGRLEVADGRVRVREG